MRGDDRVRFCDSCSKQVYNVSDLTADEAVALIQKSDGHACVRLYRRKDGTVLTADCPVGIRSALRRRLIRLASAGVVGFAMLRRALAVFGAQANSTGPRDPDRARRDVLRLGGLGRQGAGVQESPQRCGRRGDLPCSSLDADRNGAEIGVDRTVVSPVAFCVYRTTAQAWLRAAEDRG